MPGGNPWHACGAAPVPTPSLGQLPWRSVGKRKDCLDSATLLFWDTVVYMVLGIVACSSTPPIPPTGGDGSNVPHVSSSLNASACMEYSKVHPGLPRKDKQPYMGRGIAAFIQSSRLSWVGLGCAAHLSPERPTGLGSVGQPTNERLETPEKAMELSACGNPHR